MYDQHEWAHGPKVNTMTQHEIDPAIDGHTEWIVFDRSWDSWSEPCTTFLEARELSRRTGGGSIYRRTWELEPES